ncbi:uncharacterized protein [Littorina saxatilis]|uniref:uncharacterized protein isoform X2 n=1 Tax=Littorina saxatilis TaxID=31220 RepID=UPI0038B5FFFB
MRAQILLAALLFTGYVSQSDAWRNTWKKIKDKAKKVGTWVKENCSVGIPIGVSCKLNGKRALDNAAQTSLDDTCAAVGENPVATDEGFSYTLIGSIFEDADEDADGVLSAEEYEKFLESMHVFNYCLTKDN